MSKKVALYIGQLALRGGGERAAVNIANYFVQNFDYEVFLISSEYCGRGETFELDDRVKFKSILKKSSNNLFTFNILEKIQSFLGLRKLLKAFCPDFVIGFGVFPSVAVALCSPKSSKTFAYEQVAFNLCPFAWAKMREYAYPRLTGVVSLTERDLPMLTRLNSNIMVIPNATMYVGSVPSDLRSKTVLAVGRLTKQKGFDLLVEAFAKIYKEAPGWNLKIVGRGELKSDLINLIAAHGMNDVVNILDHTDDVAGQYKDASIYAMSSRWEGFPMVLVEAQAFGLPIVSFDCETGPREVIAHNQNGILVEPFDVTRFSNAIKELIGDFKMRSDFGESAIENSQKYTVKTCANKWNSFIHSE